MPQSLARMLVHLIFSTKDRSPILQSAIRPELHAYLAVVLRENDCPPLKIGGVADHVQLFFGLSRTHSMAKVVELVKTSSSKWIKIKDPEFAEFHWQGGYGAFSVSQSDADRVIRYIEEQERHHGHMTIQEEFRKFLERYQIAHDEKYVWD